MSRKSTRRAFLAQSAGAFVAVSALGESRAEQSPNEKLNLAFVGVSNKGGHNIDQLRGQNVVALCDVDAGFLEQAGGKFPKASKYSDYRKMIEKELKNIDAVVVSTADHTHAGPAALALTLGKHVYCEKPMTHTVPEARHLARLAARNKLVTQMGTQIHAGENYRRVVEIVQSGALGKVTEVYNWCNKGWSNGRFEPAGTPAPKNLDWDLWLGPAKERPFCKNIHPANWRRFWEYGSGTFGDMACHVMDLPFWALNLRHPISVEAKGPEIHPDGAPSWVLATYKFPAQDDQPAITLHWADGGEHQALVKNTLDYSGKPLSSWGLGILFVGDKGMLAANYGSYQLLPKEKFQGFQPPKPSIPRSIGHWNEWVDAIKTGKTTTCNFDYSGALTESVLLGVVAFRAGKPIQWDGEKLQVKGSPEAEEFLHKEYRKGFEIAGM